MQTNCFLIMLSACSLVARPAINFRFRGSSPVIVIYSLNSLGYIIYNEDEYNTSRKCINSVFLFHFGVFIDRASNWRN